MTDQPPAVRFDQVSKAFERHVVLDQVSFDVAPGSAFCIMGRSGTGKSVTLKHIIGLIRPDSGHVFVDGQDLTGLSGRELTGLRRRMGFLFQDAALFDSLSVLENVAFPLRRHTDLSNGDILERARGKLKEVGLEEAVGQMPAELSGGMRKRCGLARALVLDPDILLVDEPSAGLDPITSREIDRLLLDLRREGVTLIVVTHNIPSARTIASQLAVLDEGHLVAQGTVDELDRSEEPIVQAFMRSRGA